MTTACRPSRRPSSCVRSANNCTDGAQLEPEDVAKQLGRKMHNYGDYQSFGDLIIERESDGTPVTGYRRELDLDTATARVRFKQGDAGFRREYFVSYPDQVLVARWYGTSVQKLRVRFAVPDNRSVDHPRGRHAHPDFRRAEIERAQVRRRTARDSGMRHDQRRRRFPAHRERMPGHIRAGRAH